MNREKELDKIIDEHLPAIIIGQESLDSILELYPGDEKLLRQRLEIALWMAEVGKKLDPRPWFIPASRKHLEQRIATTPHRNAFQRILARYSPQRWVFNLAAPVVIVLLFALIVNSLVLTARLSIPGDPFYPAKLFIEDVQLAFTFDQVDKTNLYIQFSRERTTEFVELVLQGDYGLLLSAANRMEMDIIGTLHFMNYSSSMNPDREMPMVSALQDSLSTEITMLRVLKDTSPSSAHSGIDLAIEVAQSGLLALR
jgi:Domain of unknown function (DUF5667)